jgi:T4 RnlA family RNA ligase
MDYQNNLYSNLMKLVENSQQEKRSTFVFKDVPCIMDSNFTYRIFNYQLPKYSDFLQPSALQCRGTMFRINNTDNSFELVSLPMDKFFGLGENPSTINLKSEDIKEAYVKVDGSLISSYVTVNGKLGLKSKSEPIFAHNDIIQSYLNNGNEHLEAELLQISKDGFTVDLEFVSLNNRVILEYKEPALHILNVRDNSNGEYVDFRSLDFLSKYPYIKEYIVKKLDLDKFSNLDKNNKFLTLTDIEGAVALLKDGRLVKIKTEWYMSQHNYVNIQDFSKAGEKLFMVVMNEATDELRSLLHYRNNSPNFKLEEKLALIDKAENVILSEYNNFLIEIGNFMEKFKHLNDAKFIQAAKDNLSSDKIRIVMPLYKGKVSSLRDSFIMNFSKKIKI